MSNRIFIIAGCNGAGKTTASFTMLPEMLDCREFVNADEIARGLSPFQPETVAFEAGRIMLRRIEDLLNEGTDFAFETTLATKSYTSKIKFAKEKGYTVTLLFFWLQTVGLAKQRVRTRVSEGGHDIQPEIIARRYYRGIVNLFELYLKIADEVLIFDNSEGMPILVAEKNAEAELNIIDSNRYTHLIAQYHAGKN